MACASSRVGSSVAITGAATGLGRDIALGFAAKGYSVFGTATSAGTLQALTDDSDVSRS